MSENDLPACLTMTPRSLRLVTLLAVASLVNSQSQELTCGTSSVVTPPAEYSVDAKDGDFPWLVRLSVRCTGAILGRHWIFTAAHCLQEGDGKVMDPENLFVFVNDISVAGPDPGERVFMVDRVVSHPMFSPVTYDYDYALIHLREPLNWTPLVKPICLLQNCKSELVASPNLTCIVAGWGSDRVSYGGGNEALLDFRLKKQSIFTIPRDYCQSVMSLQPYLGFFHLTNQMTCAGYPQGGIDDCQSDSGGPLICRSSSQGTFYLHGVNSFGFGCGLPRNFYRIFSRPCAVTRWILQASRPPP